MKYFTISFFILSVITRIHAQTIPSVADTKIDSLARISKRLINSNQADSLYALMGNSFKQEISLDKMREVVAAISNQLDKWTGLEFQDITNGVAHYKAIFTVIPLNFYISLDKEDKIETFLFKP